MTQIGSQDTVLLKPTIFEEAVGSVHGFFYTELWVSTCTIVACSTPVCRVHTYSKKKCNKYISENLNLARLFQLSAKLSDSDKQI